MRAILSKTVLIALAIGATTGVALAESGSDHLMGFHLRHEGLASQSAGRDSGQGLVQLIEEQPTAAGPVTEQPSQSIQQPEFSYRSPILLDRALYGSPK